MESIDLGAPGPRLLDGKPGQHASRLADSLGDGASVDIMYSRDMVVSEPLTKGRGGKKMREVLTGVRGGDQASNVDSTRFEIGRQIFQDTVQSISGWDAVIANERKGKDKDLRAKTGISQGFRIADHAGGKDDFSGGASGGTIAGALTDIAILKFKLHQVLVTRRVGCERHGVLRKGKDASRPMGGRNDYGTSWTNKPWKSEVA